MLRTKEAPCRQVQYWVASSLCDTISTRGQVSRRASQQVLCKVSILFLPKKCWKLNSRVGVGNKPPSYVSSASPSCMENMVIGHNLLTCISFIVHDLLLQKPYYHLLVMIDYTNPFFCCKRSTSPLVNRQRTELAEEQKGGGTAKQVSATPAPLSLHQLVHNYRFGNCHSNAHSGKFQDFVN